MTLASPAADAASDLRLQRANDGTLVVVGSGWRPGHRLVVSLGQELFTTYADGAGDFEIPTGLSTYHGDLTVHRVTRMALPRAPLAPHPVAVLLAQGFAEGAALTGALIGLAMLTIGVRHWTRA